MTTPDPRRVSRRVDDAQDTGFVSGGLPLQVDAGYRFNPYLHAGAYGGYTFESAKNCVGPGNCSAHGFRIGANVQYHPLGPATVGPWLGIGAGYEWLSLGAGLGGLSKDVVFHGFELVNLQLGLDLEARPGFRIGPVAILSIAQYWKEDVAGNSGGDTIDSDSRRIHGWVLLGVRARFRP